MRIGLINPNRYTDTHRLPLGLVSIGTVIKNAGYRVQIIDADLLNLSTRDLLPIIKDFDVIGLSAMTPSYPEAENIAAAVKDNYPDKWTVIGGVHASIFPKQLLDTGLYNAVVTGPGEHIINCILSHIDRRRYKFHTIYNGYVSSPQQASMMKEYVANEIEKVIPDYSLVDVLAYKPRYPHGVRENWTIASASRGCPYKCLFCSRAVFGNHYRYMPAKNVVQMVTGLYNDYRIRDITFYDDEFTISQERTSYLCDAIIESGLDLTWTCESRVNSVNPAMLSLMKDAGCRLIYFGIESGNQQVLNTLKKGTTLRQIEEAVNMTQDAGIQAAGYFMIGVPGETKETIRQTVDFSRRLGLDHAQFSICSPLPGSELYQIYEKTHDIKNWNEFQYLSRARKAMFTTDELTADYLEKVCEEANAFYYEAVK